MRIRPISFALLVIFIGLSGCSAFEKKVLPKHDEVLIYPLPFDLTYLRAIEALQTVSREWDLQETDKEKGIIVVRNLNFSSLSDSDQRIVTFNIRRISRNETSIQIDPAFQHIIGGDVLLKKVAESLNREIQS